MTPTRAALTRRGAGRAPRPAHDRRALLPVGWGARQVGDAVPPPAGRTPPSTARVIAESTRERRGRLGALSPNSSVVWGRRRWRLRRTRPTSGASRTCSTSAAGTDRLLRTAAELGRHLTRVDGALGEDRTRPALARLRPHPIRDEAARSPAAGNLVETGEAFLDGRCRTAPEQRLGQRLDHRRPCCPAPGSTRRGRCGS